MTIYKAATLPKFILLSPQGMQGGCAGVVVAADWRRTQAR